MTRTTWPLLAGAIMLLSGAAAAADVTPGNWRIVFLDDELKPQTFWIVKLDKADNKWTGEVVATGEGLPPSTMEGLVVAGDRLTFTIRARGQSLVFEGRAGADKKIYGSMNLGRQVLPVQMEATAATTLDRYEANKEIVAGPATDLRVFQAALELLARAGPKKAKPEEVRGWADKAFKAAESYGPRWQREVATRNADVLLDQEGFAPIALEHARRAERLLEPTDRVGAQMRVLNLLARALEKAGKTDEAKEVKARVEKLDFSVKAEKFAGRQAKSERVVLVELFTGAQCPPCVAADLAFDALGKTFKPTEVALLQYHVHIPGPDPLTSPASLARMEFYGDVVEGTPTILFNGKAGAEGGGGYDDAPDKYKQFRRIIEALLETQAPVQLKAAAVQKGNKIDITADVAMEKPLEKARLRFALVEDTVTYTGGNGLKTHHHVVRALPGGAQGFAVKDKTLKQSVTVDLDELRKELTKYLDDFAKEVPFPNAQRPLDLKNLRVVAFVQNDATKEVLQAAQVEIKVEK